MNKTILSIFSMGVLLLRAEAGDFSRSATFDSVETFEKEGASFRPASSKTDLSALFTVPELGQRDDPQFGLPRTAEAIRSAAILWKDDSHALVFLVAKPPTEATPSAAGALFLLKAEEKSWRIADVQRFTATGRFADVSAELTAETGVGYQLGSDGMAPVVTIRESHGGNGYAYQISASYTLGNSRIKRLDPK